MYMAFSSLNTLNSICQYNTIKSPPVTINATSLNAVLTTPTDGNAGYKYFVFTNSVAGTTKRITFNEIPQVGVSLQVLCIAGGGSGGSKGAGGGAGGMVQTSTNLSYSVNPVILTITVGPGGTASTGAIGKIGTNSTVSCPQITTITAYGGGLGANTVTPKGGNGGSGGGGSSGLANSIGIGVSDQGNNGGYTTEVGNVFQGGGGGASGAGSIANNNNKGGTGAMPNTTILSGLFGTTIASTTYCIGGDGGRGSGQVGPVNSGQGGSGVAFSTVASGYGQAGIVVIAYK